MFLSDEFLDKGDIDVDIEGDDKMDDEVLDVDANR